MAVCLEGRLRACKNVLTLGVRPNFCDYSNDEKKKIREAEKIYYPSVFYADLFDAMGKKTFPSYHTYKCVQDKIKQTALFHLLDIPHPRTRAFYGKRQYKTIPAYFDFPCIGKIPRGSARGRGVFLLTNSEELDRYLALTDVAYIQDFLPIDRDIRVVDCRPTPGGGLLANSTGQGIQNQYILGRKGEFGFGAPDSSWAGR